MKTGEELFKCRKTRRTLQTLGLLLVPVGYGLLWAAMNLNIFLALPGMVIAVAGLVLLARSVVHPQFRGLSPALRELDLQESGMDRSAFLAKMRRQRRLHWIGGYLTVTAGTVVMSNGLLGSGGLPVILGALAAYIGMAVVFRSIFHDTYWGLGRAMKETA